MSQLTGPFEYYLCGTALSTHASYLSRYWEGEHPREIRITAYVAGMFEHVVYAAYKIALIVEFVFVDLALAVHYLYVRLSEKEESRTKIMESETRLFVGLLVLGESLPALCVDVIGMVCPPVAYKVHHYFKELITRRCLEKWGMITYAMTPQRFHSKEFLRKIYR